MDTPSLTEDDKLLSEAVVKATTSVFESMIGIDVEFLCSEESKAATMNSEVVSLISFTGKYIGTLSTFFNAETALQSASGMLGMECTSVADEDVQDVIGEITNMVAGNIKTSMEKVYGELHLSIPIVICGKSLSVSSTGGASTQEQGATSSVSFANKESWLLSRFKMDVGTFTIGMLVKKVGN
ncbi:MAG: chemotaxis protein CheX [Candidatus Anammoxibacter sp.]